MKIPNEVSEAMFKHAKVKRDDLYTALRHMAPIYLGKFFTDWSAANPSRYFDFIVTEWLIHFRAPKGSFPFRVSIPGQEAKHYFVRWADGTLIDLTAEQFDQWELVDYAEAKKASLPDKLSTRAVVLDALMLAMPK